MEYFIPSDLGIDRFFSMTLGVFMLLISWIVIFNAKYQFRKHSQKSGPNNETTELIETGLFKYSRNPIYLAVVFIVPAIGFIVNSVWLVMTIIPCFFMIEKMLIKSEEKYLYRKFSDKYLDYCKKVPRWF